MASFNRESRLRDALAGVKGDYDHILIDCSPSLGLLTINALAASDAVAIVMSTDVLDLEGAKLLYESLQALKRQINQQLAILGLIRTRFDARTTHSSLVAKKAAGLLGHHIHVFETIINERTAIKDAAATNQLIYEYTSSRPAVTDYTKLSEELYHVIEA